MVFFPSLSVQGHYRLSVGAFYFMQGLVFSSWASRIPDIKGSLHVNDAVWGSLLLGIPVGQMTAMGLSGYLVARYGSRNMLTLAAILYPLCLLGLGLAASVWTLTAALFLFGMAANLQNISVNTQGVGVERLYRGSIMASFHGLWSLAGFTGGLISAWAMSASVTPAVHFSAILVLSLGILLFMRGSMLPRDAAPPKQERQEKPRTKRFFRPDRTIALLGFIAFSSMACEGTMFDWSGVYFEEVVRPGRELIGLGYVAFMSTMACGRFLADRIVNRFGVVPVIRSSGVIIAAGLMLSVLFPQFETALAGFLLVGLGVSSIVPLCYSLAGRSTTMHPGVAVASVSTIGFLGFLLGPPVIGFVSHASSLRWSFTLIALVGLLTTILAPRLSSSEKKEAPSSEKDGGEVCL